MPNKYELTSETKVVFGKTLYRIRALVAFGDVAVGELAKIHIEDAEAS